MRTKLHISTLWTSVAILLLTMSACVSVEVQQERGELMFRTVAITKASAGTISKAPAGTISKAPGAATTPYQPATLGLFANYTEDPNGTDIPLTWDKSDFWTSGGTNLFLSDVLFAPFNGNYAGADPNNISTHIPYYWPYTGSLAFAAYSPHQSQDAAITGVAIKNYAEPTNASRMEINVALDPARVKESGSHLDLLWADNHSINGNKTAGRQSVAIPVVMRHAQTKVTFRFINEQEQYKAKARILNCVSKATFYSGKTPGWLPDFADTQNTVQDFDICAESPLSATAVEESLLLIPMILDGKYPTVAPDLNKVVTLELTLKAMDNVGDCTYLFPMNVYTDIWEISKHYTYTINITSPKIEFAEPTIDVVTQVIDL